MDHSQARKVLGVNKDSSSEDIKKKFKEMASANHPDKNGGSDLKFKEINSAYETLKNPEPKQQPNPFSGQGGGFNPFGAGGFDFRDIFGGNFHRAEQQEVKEYPPINLNVTISFEEAVLGVTKEFSINRNSVCEKCDGEGSFKKNKCKTCNGVGQTSTRQGNMIFQQTCHTCHGRGGDSETCSECKGEQVIYGKKKITVPIHGITSSQTIKLRGGGNVVQQGGFFGGGWVQEDATLNITVTPHSSFKVEEDDVISELEVSLLDAIEGKTISQEVIKGKVDLKLPKHSHNGDKLSIKGFGIKKANGQRGNHIVKVKVKYPSDCSKLISALKAE